MKHIDRLLKPLSDVPLQAYLDNRLQLFDVLEFILSQTGPAKVYVSTFSTSEEFLRRLFSLRKRMLIIKSILLADLKAARKTVNLYTFMSSVFDDVYLSENHSKVLLVENDRWMVTVVTSQNQTRGNRTECAIITTQPDRIKELAAMLTPVSDIAVLMDVDERRLREIISDKSHPVSIAYRKGKAERASQIRQNELELAEAGSPLAVQLIGTYLRDMDSDEDL